MRNRIYIVGRLNNEENVREFSAFIFSLFVSRVEGMRPNSFWRIPVLTRDGL